MGVVGEFSLSSLSFFFFLPLSSLFLAPPRWPLFFVFSRDVLHIPLILLFSFPAKKELQSHGAGDFPALNR
jgi:hypothetical protein